MGRTITFADLDALSSTFGAWLQGIGCTKGTRVALMMPNILQYPICLFGTLRAGCTVVNVNPLYTPRELEHQLVDSGAEVIVVVENFAQTLQQVVARTEIRQIVVTSIGELLGGQGPHRRSRAAAREARDAEVVAARRDPVHRCDEAGPQALAVARPDRPRRPRVPAVHGRHDRRREGRDAPAPEHRREHAAGARVAAAGPRRQRGAR